RAEFSYGRHGAPTTRALQDVLMSLEGPQCAGVGLTPSGLAAITTTLLSVLKVGDHLLVTDNVYRPSRNFCNGMLARYGVDVSYFDPLVGACIEKLFKPNTRAVLVEAPVPMTSSWRCAAPARFRCGSRSTIARASNWRAGSPPVRKCCRSCIRRLKATPAMRSGSVTSPAPPACSALS